VFPLDHNSAAACCSSLFDSTPSLIEHTQGRGQIGRAVGLMFVLQ
jgi:hypothetical protein